MECVGYRNGKDAPKRTGSRDDRCDRCHVTNVGEQRLEKRERAGALALWHHRRARLAAPSAPCSEDASVAMAAVSEDSNWAHKATRDGRCLKTSTLPRYVCRRVAASRRVAECSMKERWRLWGQDARRPTAELLYFFLSVFDGEECNLH